MVNGRSFQTGILAILVIMQLAGCGGGGGGDWHSSGDGLTDPDGHGSHVAGILAAGQNNGGMHGVAPSAALYSYRILNDYGFFGSQTGETMIPGLVQAALSDNINFVNNSWASNYEINDLPKNSISSQMPDELNAWQRSVSGTARPSMSGRFPGWLPRTALTAECWSLAGRPDPLAGSALWPFV